MFALLLSLTTPAMADVPPPTGYKRVPYNVKLEGYDAKGAFRIAVYPWSDSNGAPTAEAAVIGANGTQSFGRRIRGTPVFHSVPADKVGELNALDEGALKAWFETNAMPCTGASPSPRHQVSVMGPSKIIDVVKVVTLDASACALEATEAPAAVETKPATDAPASRCATVPESMVFFGLIALLPLFRRRRA